MADTEVSAIETEILPSQLTEDDFLYISRAGASDAKLDASLLLPPLFAFTSAGAVGAKTLTIAPANPGGSSHANYQLRVAAVDVGADEAINLGYNVGGVNNTEPVSVLIQEIDYLATARGVASQRTMEWYAQFAGAGSPGDFNVSRPIFFAYEPGNSSRNGDAGELLYGYLSTGHNRAGTPGGGGLTIATDLQEGVGGGPGDYGGGVSFWDVDGSNHFGLRSVPGPGAISSATAANPCVITVASTAGYNIGCSVQIWKPDANGVLRRNWVGAGASLEDGTACVGVVTALTGTTLTLTGIDNTSLGIGSTFKYQMARSAASWYSSSFMSASVGTGNPAAVAFTLNVTGTTGLVGGLNLATAAVVTALGRTITSGDFMTSPLSIRGTDTTAGGRRQHISAYPGAGVGWSLGFPDDVTGDNLDNLLFGIGAPQPTDSAFTVTRTSLCCFNSQSDNSSLVGIGGISPYNRAKLVIAAGTTAHAQIGLATSTLKTTPVVGDFCFDGTNFRACVSAGTWGTVTVT